MYSKYLKVFSLYFIVLCINSPVDIFGAEISPKLKQEISQGNVKVAIDSCAEALYNSEDQSETAKLNVIMSMLLLLDLNPHATDRLSTIQSFMMNKNHDESNAKTILGYLSKQFSGNKLIAQMKTADNNWQATALVARYIRILNELGVKPKLLNQCIVNYMAISDKLQPGDWGNIWKKRVILWHNSLQNSENNTSGLEPLIAKAKEDMLSGPIKEQLTEINTIINDLLLTKKLSATKNANRALIALGAARKSSENLSYAMLLDYLGGGKVTTQELFKTTMNHNDFLLITAVAFFVKKLSDAKPGELSKSELITYLNNYTKNSNNSQQELVLKWRPTVEKWKRWCEADFPYSSSLKPLLATHSKAMLAKNRDQAVQKEALAVYSKLSRMTSLNRVSINDYKKMRVIFKNRPHPASMEFTSSAMKGYVASLPVDVQNGEWYRIRYMHSFKKNMIDNLNFSQYRGAIKIKSRSVNGTVLKADTNAITIKSSYGTKKYKWEDIQPEQYIKFSLDYIKNNKGTKVHGKENIFSTGEADMDKAKAYRMLAIFCDWYGKYPEALNYGKKSDSYPSSKNAACKLLLQ